MNIYVEMTDSHEIDRFSFRCLLIKSLCFPYSQWSLWCLYWQTGHKRRKEGLYKICRLENPRVFFSKNFQNNKILLLLSFLGSQEYSDFFFHFVHALKFRQLCLCFPASEQSCMIPTSGFWRFVVVKRMENKMSSADFWRSFFPIINFLLIGLCGHQKPTKSYNVVLFKSWQSIARNSLIFSQRNSSSDASG